MSPRRESPRGRADGAPLGSRRRGGSPTPAVAPGVYAAVPGPASPELVRRGDEVLALDVLERPASARGGRDGRLASRPWMSLLPDAEAARAQARADAVVARVEARLRLDAERARARAAWEAARAAEP